jgi:hypothetical protein
LTAAEFFQHSALGQIKRKLCPTIYNSWKLGKKCDQEQCRKRTLMSDERAFLFDKLVNFLHEELPAVVHQQVQVDPLPPVE